MLEDGPGEDDDESMIAMEDDDWEGTMREVSHIPEVGDRVSEIWNRGGE